MKRTLSRIIGLLLLVSTVSVGAAGCLLVPVGGDDGHEHHGYRHERYRHYGYNR